MTAAPEKRLDLPAPVTETGGGSGVGDARLRELAAALGAMLAREHYAARAVAEPNSN
jgi:hypothetical protein